MNMAHRYLCVSVGLLILAFAAPSTARFLPRCDRHSECNDNNDATLDYCSALATVCANVPKVINAELTTTVAIRRTRGFIISQANAAQLTLAEQLGIVDYVTFLQRDLHPHRDLHLRFLKVDIIPKLNRLRNLLKSRGTPLKNVNFHRRVILILQQIDDFHTQYFTPAPLRQGTAFLPFNMAEFYEGTSASPRFVVSEIVDGALLPNQEAKFKVGVEILKWNGKPVLSAITAQGEEGIGNNPSARLARGLQDITNRNFLLQVLPDAGPVRVQYKDLNGVVRTTSFRWIYSQLPLDVSNGLGAIPNDFPPGTTTPTTVFDSAVVQPPAGSTTTTTGSGFTVKRTKVQVTSPFDNDIAAESVEVTMGGQTTNFGMLRLYDFTPTDFAFEAYFTEVKRLILGNVLPSTGMVVDIRNNLGGLGFVCQRIPQLFTNSIVFSSGAVNRLTELGAAIALNRPRSTAPLQSDEAFQALRETNLIKVRIGDQFSAFNDGNLTALINSDPGLYPGKVILLTSATTYSCGEVVAANFLDTQPPIGKVIGVADATGGGAALTLDSLELFGSDPSVFAPPSGGIFTRNNVFRLERTGFKKDSTFEWFGITPNEVYRPSKADAVNDEADLAKFLSTELNNM